MRKVLLFILGLTLWQSSFAKIVTGKIISNTEPEGLIGVTVMVKGTTIGTVTNVLGEYSVDMPDDKNVLVFSYIGYLTQEIEINGRDIVNVTLIEDVTILEGVVVTALGIKRSEKALGYAVQNVKGDDVALVKEPDVMNALSGKVAGVNIIQSSGAIGGGGSRVVIRGENSLAGNNDPLYIINGIKGDPNDIAPDDIESISVLKGPAAAALYGAKAGSGVVIITSKSGKGADGFEVSFNSSTTFQTPLVLPEYQNKYGMGLNGYYSYYDGSTNEEPYYDDVNYNWGPEFDGEKRSQFTGNDPWVAYPDNVKDFYEVGYILINNISVSNSSDKGNYRFSYTRTDQKGILPNNGLNKNNFSLNSTFNLTEGLTLNSNIGYLRTDCANSREVDVRFIHRNIDIAALKDYWVPGQEGYQQLNYRASGNNPYFVLYENPYSYKDTKMLANVTLNYEINNHWSLLGRFGTNFTNNEYADKRAYSTYDSNETRSLNGYYKTGLANTWDRTAEFLVSYNKTLLGSLNLKLSAGGTHYRYEYKKLEGQTYELTKQGIYNLNNRDGYLGGSEETDLGIYDEIAEKERNSLYAFLNLDYKGKVFFDITRRDDWSSTLHPDNNHFSYHSVVASGIISEMVNLPSFISFMKMRASVAQVGNDIPKPYFTVEDEYTYTEYAGKTTISPTGTKTDPYLEPEKTTGYEAGIDIRLLNNRLGFDVTYYYSNTKNQILKTQISATSGGDDEVLINAGEIENKGVEVTINATPVKTGDFRWNTQLNWSYDRSYVVELLESDPTFEKAQKVNSFLYIHDKKGQRRGTFYGKSYERAPNGERLYTKTGDTMLTDETQLGNYNPDWMASMSNDFKYKNLSLSFLLDLRYGGLIYNEIERKLNFYGLSKATLLNDREGIVPKGVYEADDGSYQWLSSDVLTNGGQSGKQYWENQMEETVPENELIDDTYLKLRELRIAYQVPSKWMQKTFVKSATVSLVGRNLAVWSKVKHVDPETYGIASEQNDFGYNTKVPGYANASVPSVRSYGFTFNCKF